MSVCKNCGAALEEGASFCPGCGTPVSGSEGRKKRRRKSIFQRVWFWLLILIAAGVFVAKTQFISPSVPVLEHMEAVETVSGDTVRPQVREFIDAYEQCYYEYVDMMKKYNDADGFSVGLLLTYLRTTARYERLTEEMMKTDRLDFTEAEAAYLLKAETRISQRIISSASG